MQIAYHTVSAVLKADGTRLAIFPYFTGSIEDAISVCKDQLKIHNMTDAYEDFRVRSFTINHVDVIEALAA